MKSIIFTKKELFSVVVISALSIFCHASDVDVSYVNSDDIPFESIVRTNDKMFVKLSRPVIVKKIEGYCLVDFTITKEGSTKDIRILECKKKNGRDTTALNKDTIRNIVKYKYVPVVVNGQVVEVRGVKLRFTIKFSS
tara:strand:- start:114 stop:527 length:414 start_codon:yes stop_codon:yes gene_type:complete